MMSPTSQFNTEQIFSNTSMLTFSSLDNFDIVVLLKPVCKRKSFLSYLYQSAFSTAFYSILPYCHLLPLFLLKVQYSRYFLHHSIEVRIVQSRCQKFKYSDNSDQYPCYCQTSITNQYFYQPVHNSGNDRIGNDSYIAVFTLIVDFDDRLTEILRNARKEQLKNRIPYGELYHKNYYREVKDKNRVYYEFYHLDGVLERV